MNPLLTIEAAYALPQNTFIGLRLTPQGDPEKTVLVFAPPNSHLYGFRIGTEFHPSHGDTIDYRPMLLLPQPRLEAEAAENLWAAVYPDRGPWSTIGEEARAEWRHFLEVALAQNAAPPPPELTESFAALGQRIYAKVTGHVSDGECDEWCEDIMKIATDLGLAKQEIYNPEVHGIEIDAEPGVDPIWTWSHLPKGWKTGFPAARFLDPATGQDQPNLSQRGVLVMPNDKDLARRAMDSK